MNEKKKTLILLLLVFAVFGLAGWRIASVPGPAPAADSKVTALDQNGQPVPANTIQMGGAPSEKPAKQIVVAAPAPIAGPDPFKSTIKPSTADQANRPITVADVPAPRRSTPRESSTIRSSDLDQPVNPLKGDILPTAGGTDSRVEVKPDPTPSIRVAGVITGDKAVAILKMGDQQFVVSVGDMFGDGYQLKSVTDTQVVIKEGKKTVYLSAASF